MKNNFQKSLYFSCFLKSQHTALRQARTNIQISQYKTIIANNHNYQYFESSRSGSMVDKRNTQFWSEVFVEHLTQNLVMSGIPIHLNTSYTVYNQSLSNITSQCLKEKLWQKSLTSYEGIMNFFLLILLCSENV